VKNNFSLTSNQTKGVDILPDSLVKELGMGIGIALQNNWRLVIEEDKNLPKGKVTQSVSGTYDDSTGNWTATKTVTWNWC